MKAPAPSYLQQVLAEYRSGPVESSGTFTLDPARAREMLRRFALESPHLWVLRAVASAVESGATGIDVTARDATVELTYDGEGLTADQLANLYSALLVGRAAGHLRELAVAVNAARALEPSVLAFATPGFSADFTVDPPRVEPGDGAGNRLTLVRPVRRALFGLWSREDPLPEIEALKTRCRHCPIPMRLNGEDVPLPVGDPGAVIAHHLYHPDAALAVSELTAGQRYSRPSPGRFSALLTLGSGEGLEVVLSGVSYFEELPWPVPGLKIVVADPALKTDLSRARVVRDEAFNQLADHLWDEYEDMLVQLYYYRESLDARALPFVEQLMDLACREEHFKQAAEIGAWLRDRWDTEPMEATARASGFYKYSIILRRAGKVGAGEALHKRAQTMWSQLSSQVAQATLPGGIRLEGDALVQYLRCRCEETVLGSDDPSFCERLTLYALHCENAGRWNEAELYHRWLLDIRAASLEADDGELIRRQASLAGACLHLGKHQEATALLEKALEQHRGSRSEDWRLELTMLGQLAALRSSSDPERAADLYRRSLAVRRNKLGPDHPDLVPDLRHLVGLLERLGKTGDAAALRRRLEELEG